MKVLVFWETDVLCGQRPVHLGGRICGVGHRLETRQQAVAQAFHQDATIARQYLGNDDMDKVRPSTNRGGFMLLHEPDRFHEVDQQHDRLLAHESNACASNVGELGRRDLILGLVSILIHVDLARDPGLHT